MRLIGLSVLFFILHFGDTYRILGLFPYNGASHFTMFKVLMKGLAQRGHQLDVVSHFPLKEPFPNYNDVIDLSLEETIVGRRSNVTWDFIKGFLNAKSFGKPVAIDGGNAACHFLDHPQFKELIKNPPKDPPYDLVIAEIFGMDCFFAMGQHLGVPIVAGVPSAMWPWANDMIANPEELAYVPHVFSGLEGRMTFWQRFQNTLDVLQEKWLFNYHSACQTDMIKKYIGPHAPSVRDAERNISLVLVNSHFTFNGPRPFTTAVVEVGGLHIPKDVDALPTDFQKWLDESKDGFVYISFGSMLKIESFPKETLLALYASLAKLAPIRVLMKITDPEELPPGLPKNVLTRPWIPQLGVLHHKHARAFMTHGGLLGTQEAIYFGVPMIGVPIFADQPQNIQLGVKKGIAVYLNIVNLTEENMDEAFDAILNDPSYTKAVKKLSTEFRDRPMSPLDTGIFWVEYVIRHGGANLRSPAMELTWWQILLLDVYGALLSAVILFTYLLALIINRLILKKDPKKVTPSKKNK